jgi:chromate reductase
VPRFLKNAIDHASRPYGESAWEGKPAGVIRHVVGRHRDRDRAVAPADDPRVPRHAHARPAGDVPQEHQEGFFDADGQVGEKSRDHVRKWLERYGEWVRSHGRPAGQARKAA